MTTGNDNKEKLKTLTIRVPPSWVARLDGCIAKMQFPPTRTSVILDVLSCWMDAEDMRHNESATKADSNSSMGYVEWPSYEERLIRERSSDGDEQE